MSELRIKEIVLREDGNVGLISTGRMYPDTILFADMLDELDRMGIDYDDLEVKKNVPVSFIAVCEDSPRTNRDGVPFKNVVSLRLPSDRAVSVASTEKTIGTTDRGSIVEKLQELLREQQRTNNLLEYMRDIELSTNERIGRLLEIWENQEGEQGE